MQQVRHWNRLGFRILAVALAGSWGCADDTGPTDVVKNRPPETLIVSAPLEYDTTAIRVHLYWNGTDTDGEVARYRIAIDDGGTEPVAMWQATTATDSILRFPVGPIGATKQHRFQVAAEDNGGMLDPTPASRTFSSQTIPPTSCVTRGPSNSSVSTTFTFEWSGSDPDGGLTGGPTPVDSFEYLLLRPGTVADPLNPGAHQPLPPYNQSVYLDLIQRATGDALPEPYDDWKWVGVPGSSKRFQDVPPGPYVFALRAIDAAGAREEAIEMNCNVRAFSATAPRPVPLYLSVCIAQLPGCLTASGPVDQPRSPWEFMEGEPVEFTWRANSNYGSPIDGFTYALDDTSAFPPLDPLLTGATFGPSQLTAGYHALYVRVRAEDGAVTNAVVPIYIVHPTFKEPGAAREILYVDDALGPGNYTGRIGNYPSDIEETDWWMLTLLPHLGAPVTEWDTYNRGLADVQGRKPPGLRDLVNYSTVVWNVDFNNGAQLEQSTGLWKTLVADGYSELATYLRAGGTLILTGFSIAGSVTNPNSTLYANANTGICSTLDPGSAMYKYAFFPRTMMGLDGALASYEALRTFGARDFIAGWPTDAGIAAGYDSAFIDRGTSGSGAKWITDAGSGDPNLFLSPGLPRVDGWKPAADFACDPNAALNFRVEDPSRPIAEVIYRYHGVNMGADETGGPSPREGLAVGVRVQAHDLGGADGDEPYGGGGGTLSPGSPGVIGRTVYIGIPLYFLRDADARRIIETAFRYVNESPTLP